MPQLFPTLRSTAVILLLVVNGAVAAGDDEITQLRQMIEALRSDYEQRILALERRLEQAEAATDAAPRLLSTAVPPGGGAVGYPAVTAVASVPGGIAAGNAFNPQTSVILNGNYYHDEVDGNGPGFASSALQPSAPPHEDEGHGHGGITNGFNVAEAELAFAAAVDPYFDAVTYLTVDGAGDLHLEEAWFQTRRLPHGLKLKGGKFLSDIGYSNSQHPHQWDFADQSLVYLNLLGDHGLQDTGLQVTWLPESPVYLLLGAELLQGEQERLGAIVEDAEDRESLGLDSPADGPRLWTAFVKVAPDLGYDHALQLGASYAHARQHQEIYRLGTGAELGLEGDADLWGLEAVYKYDRGKRFGQGNFTLQLEYLRAVKDLRGHPIATMAPGPGLEFDTDGLYLQGVYGLAPRWQAGVRYEIFGMTNDVSGTGRTDLGSSDRWTLGLSWLPTEFSRLRLQYEYSDLLLEAGEREAFGALWLQFIMSMGAHGAHRF